MSCTVRVDTQPRTHFHQVRTSPRVQGHTLHTQGVSEAFLNHKGVRRWVRDQIASKPEYIGFEKPMFSNDIGEGVTSHQYVLLGGDGRAGRSG